MQSVLLEDAFAMMEHGKMSLPEALKMGLSFVRMYQQSPSFEMSNKRFENERVFKTSIIERLDAILKSNQSRR